MINSINWSPSTYAERLKNVITAIKLIESAKYAFILQSKEEVFSSRHQNLLDEVDSLCVILNQTWYVIFLQETVYVGDRASQNTLLNEKVKVDWVKVYQFLSI